MTRSFCAGDPVVEREQARVQGCAAPPVRLALPAGLRAVPAGAFSRQCRLGARASACQRSSLARLWRSARRSSCAWVVSLGFAIFGLLPGLVSLWECLITDDSRCAQAFLQTNSDLRLFCPSKRIADLVSRSPGRNTSAFLYYFSRGPRPGDWLSNQQVRPSSLLSDADVPGNSFPRPIVLDSCATRER